MEGRGRMNEELKPLTAEGVAWFLMGEGDISFRIVRNRNFRLGFSEDLRVGFSNTDKALLDEIEKWLESNGIRHYKPWFGQSKWRKKRCYRLVVHSPRNVEKLLKILLPYLRGVKRKQAELMLEFIRKFHRGHAEHVYETVEEKAQRLIEMARYADRMSKLIGSRARRKYTEQFFLKWFKEHPPPTAHRYTCKKCGYVWISYMDKRPSVCARCGATEWWKPKKFTLRPFSPEEDDFIRKNFPIMKDKEIAERLGRTVRSIRGRRYRLGLRRWGKREKNCTN